MWNNFIKFLSELNAYEAFITLLVGGIAIFLYVKQKKDRKRDAAKLVLQEIRYAEQQIRNYKIANRYKLSTRLLPTDSWNDNIHLFLQDLKESEIDIISSFYSRAAYIDVLIRKISDAKTSQDMRIVDPSESKKEESGENTLPAAIITQQILKQTSYETEFVYNTPAAEKLRQIARKRWYEI